MTASNTQYKKIDIIILAIVTLYGLFHLYYSTLDTISESWRNSIHAGGAAFFVFWFASQRTNQKFQKYFFILCSLVTLTVPAYVVGMEEALFNRGDELIWSDLWMTGIVLFLVLFATGIAGGWVLTGIAIVCVAYTLFLGAEISGNWGFRGISYYTFSERIFWGGEGYFGFLTSISSTYVYLFILYGTLLLAAGSGRFLVQAALRIGSKLSGGPAQAAVIGSALMGSVTGNSIGNVMATGSVTIPMMIRSGYKREFAAGVEASASNIGQIAPPVMGAGVFILAAWTQVPYTTIVVLSILPAFLYFYSVFVGVAIYARRENFVPDIELEPIEWRNGIPFVVGMATLIGGLMSGFTAIYSCCIACATVVGSSWVTKENKIGFNSIVTVFYDTAKTASITAMMLAASNVVVGLLTLTGKAVTFSSILFDAAQGNVYFMIAAVLLISLILGMGLPITASYIIVAVVVGTGFEPFGFSLVAIHLMIFWYSQDSTVTPPIALSAFAAAGIANAKPFPASIFAWKLSKGLYVIPLLLLSGDILFENGTEAALLAFGCALIGLTGLAISLMRYCFSGSVATWLSIPMFASSVGCFLLDRDIAQISTIVCAALMILSEIIARLSSAKNEESMTTNES